MPQITAGSGYNVKDAAKKHEKLTKVWTHTVDHGWVSRVDLALNAASGNSDTGYFTAGLTLDKKRGGDEYVAKISYAYGEESSAAYFWGELGIETLLTERMSLKLYLQDSYENSPAAGKEHNDLRIIADLSFKL